MERVVLDKPLSPSQEIVAVLVGLGYNYQQVAEQMKIAYSTVLFHANEGAMKIPGDLPTQQKLLIWARGGTLDVLLGETLRTEVIRNVIHRQTRRGKIGMTSGAMTPQVMRVSQTNGRIEVTASDRG